MDQALDTHPLEESVAFPIRFEPPDSLTFCDKEAAFVSAIILHNFGVSCFCKARTSGISFIGAQRLRNMAFKTYHLCQCVLSKHSPQCSDPHHLKSLLFLGYVVVSSMMQGLLASGLMEQAQALYGRLTHLRSGIQELSRSESLFYPSGTAPAA